MVVGRLARRLGIMALRHSFSESAGMLARVREIPYSARRIIFAVFADRPQP